MITRKVQVSGRPLLFPRTPLVAEDTPLPKAEESRASAQRPTDYRHSLAIVEERAASPFDQSTIRGPIKVKYKDPKNHTEIETEFHCERIIPNSEQLEMVTEGIARLGKASLAIRLSDKIRELSASGELAKYKTKKGRTALNDFVKCVRVAATREGLFSAADDDEIVTLTAYYSVGSKKIQDVELPGLERLPDDLLVPGSKSFLSRVRLLAKHYVIDIKNIQNPAGFENFGNYEDEFNNAGLRIIQRSFSPPNLFDFLFPGFQDGDDPAIPLWKYFGYPNKWEGEEGKELARRASRWVLKKEGAINPDGSVALDILRSKNWSTIFYEEKYGLGGMLVSCPYTKNIFQAIQLAVPEAIGFEDDQVKPWEITSSKMWQQEDSSGRLLIDHLTKYLAEKYLPSVCGIKVLKENGKLDPEVAKKINWARLYTKVVPSALIHSSIKAHEALQRVYGDSFGYEDDQIKPWELRWEDKWEGIHGKELFKKAFLYTLAKAGLGKLDYSNGVQAIFTGKQLEERLKQDRPNIQTIITEAGLISGFRSTFNANSIEALAYAFNANCEILKTRDVIKYLRAIIENNCGYVSIELARNNKPYIDSEPPVIGDVLDVYLKEIGRIPRLSEAEINALAIRAKRGNVSARNELVRKNLRLVATIARRYLARGYSLSDLIQEGNLGLMRAAENYDPTRGRKFSTYAGKCIRGAILNFMYGKQGRISKDDSLLEVFKDLQPSEVPNESTGKGYTSVKPVTVLNETDFCGEEDSLNYSNGEESKEINILDLRADISVVLKSLAANERQVIMLRFGLDPDGYPRSLEEVARILKLSRERVNKIERRAILKLQQPGRASKLAGYVED